MHIERRRRERADATQEGGGQRGRWEALEPRTGDLPAAPPPSTVARMEHIGDPPPAAEAAEALVQPFVRCAICAVDQHRMSVNCSGCGASLTTPEQRVFNDALWERTLAEQAAARPEDAIPRNTLSAAQSA